MKKIFKSKRIQNVLFFILGGVVIGGIGITATTYILQANEIEYKNNKSVQEAIEELYTMAENGSGSNETLPTGDVNVEGFKIAIPYTGSYDKITCVYGTDNNYSNVATMDVSSCTFVGAADTTYYYKLVAIDAAGKVYEYSNSYTFGGGQPISILNVGDYVYMKPTSTSYSITSDMTGCTRSSYCNGVTNQTINPSELTLWRVIQKISDGTVDVVSDKVSLTSVYFYGSSGYANLKKSLNSIASSYADSNFVQTSRYINYANDYNLIKSVYGNLIAKNASGIATWYWLAHTSTDSDHDWHYAYRIDSGGELNEVTMYYYYNDGGEFARSSYLRPILTLKSSAKIVGGSGTSTDYYQLGL